MKCFYRVDLNFKLKRGLISLLGWKARSELIHKDGDRHNIICTVKVMIIIVCRNCKKN